MQTEPKLTRHCSSHSQRPAKVHFCEHINTGFTHRGLPVSSRYQRVKTLIKNKIMLVLYGTSGPLQAPQAVETEEILKYRPHA